VVPAPQPVTVTPSPAPVTPVKTPKTPKPQDPRTKHGLPIEVSP
jgi:hypothetical protein